PEMRVDGEEEAEIGASVAERFHHGDRRREIGSRSSVRFGNRQAEDPHVRALLPALAPERAVVIPRDHVVAELLLRELQDLAPERLRLRGKTEIHVPLRSHRSGSGYWYHHGSHVANAILVSRATRTAPTRPEEADAHDSADAGGRTRNRYPERRPGGGGARGLPVLRRVERRRIYTNWNV